jgi:hypothetical protein
MKRSWLMAAACLLGLMTLAASAQAQPMMMDPSRMSGIPRNDPQVPPGTITVRLIRGELSNRMVGIDVQLADAAGKVTTQRTDAEGRATFSGLSAASSYQARAKEGDKELTSQPIELVADMGARVMLVFPAAAGGASAGADGVARSDKKIPAGQVIVRALGDGGQPAAAVEVVLGHMRSGEQAVKELRAKTNGDGEAVFTGLDAKPTSGYLAEVVLSGQRYASKPFRLQENMGSRVVLDIRAVSKDVAALRIGNGSHFILEVQDDVVQVSEILRISNPTSAPIDPGGNGLHLPLPAHALQPQAQTQTNGVSAKAVGHEVVLTGALPPGDTALQVGYLLVYNGDSLDIEQHTPVAFEDFALVSEKIDGFVVEGDNLTSIERDLQGRKLVLYRGPGPQAGGTLSLHLHGLPHPDATWRYLAAVVTVALLLGFGAFAAAGKSGRATPAQLESEREQLLGQLVALEQKSGAADDDKRERRKRDLTARLAKVYRAIDEVHH